MAASLTALSTSFFPVRQERDGEKLLAAIRDLPVSGIELDYRLPAPVYHHIRPLLHTTGIRVVSVHNFFPLPLEFLKTGGDGDLFSLSDLRHEERQEAVRRTLQTIDHAHDLEARAVVLHCGRVDMEADTERLYQDVRKNGASTEKIRQWLAKKVAERDRLKPAHLDALRFSLDKLLRAADKRSLRLGLETRYHYHELPSPDDFEDLLKEFDGAPLGYWHDTGHAFVNEHLGLMTADDLLTRLSSRLVGIHLHDAQGLEDHLPPGAGDMDFQTLVPHMATGVSSVLELRPGTPQDDVCRGLEHLKQCLQEG
jgi:sugar phosphate isomerase/epimerase